MKVTVLVDNNSYGNLGCEWGFSALVETARNVILLDAGETDVLAKNADALGIDLGKVEYCVLSHAHLDHANGFDCFFSRNAKAPLLIAASAAENCYTDEAPAGTVRPLEYIGIRQGMLQEHADRLQRVDGVVEFAPGAWIVPHGVSGVQTANATGKMYVKEGDSLLPDAFFHEQSLVVETSSGLAVFNSCSHGGVEAIIADVQAVFPGRRICAYVGGLHLYLRTEGQVRQLAETFRQLGIGRVFTGHCTGEAAMAVLKEELGQAVQAFHSGFIFEI